jgi:hypothetical protein
VHDSFEQAFRGFDRDRYLVWRDWLADAAAHPRRAGVIGRMRHAGILGLPRRAGRVATSGRAGVMAQAVQDRIAAPHKVSAPASIILWANP